MNVNNISFERTGGNDATHGKVFELEVTLLMYLKCVILFNSWKDNKFPGVKSFVVINNMKDAGKFDDVVVKLEFVHESNAETKKLIFAQCKHTELQLTNENIFARYLSLNTIKKYFETFTEITKIFHDKFEMFDCEFIDCEFLLMSNIHSPTDCVHKKTRNVGTDDHIEMVLPDNSLENEFILKNHCDCNKSNCAAKFRTSNINTTETEFLNVFRLFLKLEYTLKFEIIAVMKLIDNEMGESELESVYGILLEETKHLSNSKKHWTQDTMLLDSVIAFRYLKNIADTFVDKYRGKIKITSIPKYIENTYITHSSRLSKLKLYKFLSELNREHSLIRLRTEEDINRWVLARKTHSYRMAKQVYILLAIDLELPEPIHTNEMVYQLRKDENKETPDWNDKLVDDLKDAIKNTTINFQGNELSLEAFNCNWIDILDDKAKCDILASKPLVVKSNKLPSVSGDYIPRKFRKKVLTDELKNEIYTNLKLSQNTGNIILFPIKADTILDGYDNDYKLFHSIEEARSYFQNIKIEKKWSYYFCINDNNILELKCTFGKQNKNYCTFSRSLNEEYLLMGGKITILTGIAGAGKSETMKNLALKYKKANNCHCVYLLNLGNFVETVEEATEEDLKSPISFIALNLLRLKTIELALFKNACHRSGEATLFFDSYEELSKNARIVFCKILLSLEKTKISKMFIASRRLCVEELEKLILQNSFEFEEFDANEEQKYIMKILEENRKESGELLSDECLTDIALKTLDQIRSDSRNDVLAHPLHIKLITSAFCYVKIFKDITSDSKDLFQVYERYINLRVFHYYSKTLEANWEKLDKGKRKRIIREKLRGSQELVCLHYYKKLCANIPKFINDTKEALRDDLGLIIDETDNIPQFVHKSIVEFFAAEFVKDIFIENTEESQNTLQYIFSDDKYTFLRKFIDDKMNPSPGL